MRTRTVNWNWCVRTLTIYFTRGRAPKSFTLSHSHSLCMQYHLALINLQSLDYNNRSRWRLGIDAQFGTHCAVRSHLEVTGSTPRALVETDATAS